MAGLKVPSTSTGCPSNYVKSNLAHTTYKPGTTGPKDIDRAKCEKVYRFCEQPWEIGHACEKKKLVQMAYEQ